MPWDMGTHKRVLHRVTLGNCDDDGDGGGSDNSGDGDGDNGRSRSKNGSEGNEGSVNRESMCPVKLHRL